MTGRLTGPLAQLPVDVRDEMLTEVEALIRGVGVSASCLLTGSLAEGLGNSRSDIDVYLVVPDRFRPESQSTSIGLRSERCVDCEYMAVGGLSRLADRMDAAAAHEVVLTRKELDRYYRTSIACRYTVHPAMADLLDRFDRGVACTVAAEHFAREAVVASSQAALLFARGQTRGGLLELRRAAVARVSSVLAEEGEGYPATKWVFEKARRRWGRDSDEVADLIAASSCVERTREQVQDTLDVFTHRVMQDSGGRMLGQEWRLAARVKVLGSGLGMLVRGSAMVPDLDPTVVRLCALMQDGEPWAVAVRLVADELGVPVETVQVGVQRPCAALQADGFLDEVHREQGGVQ